MTATMLAIVVVVTLTFAFQGRCMYHHHNLHQQHNYHGLKDRYTDKANWWTSFNKKGASKCKDHYLMKGLWKSACNKLYCIEEAYCAKNHNVYATGPVLEAKWWSCLDSGHSGWCTCRDGSYLTGFYRTSGQGLHNLEKGYCHHVAHKTKWGTCYDQDVRETFNRKGLSQCVKHGHFMVGLWKKKNCDGLNCIKRFKCCQPGYSGSIKDHSWYTDKANWWTSFNKKGASKCKDHYLMKGLWKSACNKLYCIEEAYCAKNHNVYATGPVLEAKWWSCLDSGHSGWCTCRDGSYLTGFYRTSGGQGVHNLEKGYCHHVPHKTKWGDCYDQDVRETFNRKGLSQCVKHGHFMVGLWKKKNCDGLNCIQRFKCCQPGYSGAITNHTWYTDKANWWTSFNKKGASKCKDHYLMKGLWKSACNKLYCIEVAYCAKNHNVYATGPVLEANWWSCLNSGHSGWCTCRDGSYLTGFYRTSGQGLHNLEKGYCHHVAHKTKWGTCYDQDVRETFNRKGLSQCVKHGHFMVGLWKKKNCDGLNCIKRFKCCQPGYSGAITDNTWYVDKANWWVSFNKKGASKCKEHYLMKGLWKSACNKLYCIEVAYCAKNHNVYATGPVLEANWWSCLDSGHSGWCTCRDGSYLTGFYRTSGGQGLHNLEKGYCHHVPHKRKWGTCYDQDVGETFNRKGLSQCVKHGYFMVGLWKRKNCDGLNCIKKFKCCRPAAYLRGKKDICRFPKATGSCKAYLPRWYFNYRINRCMRFTYGGCRGNRNNFGTFCSCQKKCKKTAVLKPIKK